MSEEEYELEYETEEEVVKTEKVTKTISPYEEWSMFSDEGNEIIHGYAQDLISDIKKAESIEDEISAFREFFSSWFQLGEREEHKEAHDTAVRESVWVFACKVSKTTDVEREQLDSIMDEEMFN